MAAAVTLADHGVPLTVFEAGPLLGGRARRVDVREFALDNGLHILVGAYRETLRLIAQVNQDIDRVLLRRPLDWVIHRQFRLQAADWPSPFHLVAGILHAHGLGLVDRLRMLRFMAGVRFGNYAPAEDETVVRLLERYGQSARLRRMLWNPLCVAALNTRPDQASARVFLRVLRDSFSPARNDCDLLLPRTDLTTLFPEPAAAYVEARGGLIRTGCRVTAINCRNDGFNVTAGGLSHAFSHVICALPPHQANTFLIGVPALAQIAKTIERFSFQPIYSVYLHYPRSIRLPAPMLGFDSALLHWAFDREFLCGQTGLIAVVISAEGPHQKLGHDALACLVHQELQQQIGLMPEPSWHQVIAEKRATFSCTAGLERPPQATPLKDFFLAGDYTENDYPATLEAAVRSGIRCARRILESG